MSLTIIGLIADAVLAILLGVSVFYGLRIQRGIQHFKSGRAELKKLITDLSQSISRAEAAMAGMKEAANHARAELAPEQKAAQAAIQELSLINATARGLADRMEKAVDRAMSGDLMTSAASGKTARDLQQDVRDRFGASPRKNNRKPSFGRERKQAEKKTVSVASKTGQGWSQPSNWSFAGSSDGDTSENLVQFSARQDNASVQHSPTATVSRAERELMDAMKAINGVK